MKMTDIKPGDRIKGFEDFGCIPANATRIVRQDDAGRLFVACRQGHHLLDGQEDDAGELVGLSRACRLAVAVDPTGAWNACGGGTLKPEDAMDFAVEVLGDGEARYWLTAELPLPEISEVPAKVEPST